MNYQQDLPDWSCVTPTYIKETVQYIKDMTLSVVNDICKVKHENRTLENTIMPLINIFDKLSMPSKLCTMLFNKSTDADVRDASNTATKDLDAFTVVIDMHDDLYNAIKYFYNSDVYIKSKQNIHPEINRFLDHKMLAYKRAGMDLSKEKRDLVKQIKTKLVELSVSFSKNVDSDKTVCYFTKKELDGMHESWFEQVVKHTIDGVETDKYVVTMDYPNYIPCMEHIKDRNVRKQLYIAFNSRCNKENTELLSQILKLKYELAELLGYSSFADYVLEIKMAKNSKNVWNFINKLNNKLTNAMIDDIKSFKSYLGENENLEMWDIAYMMRVNTEKECNIDFEKVSQYFPYDQVTKGLLETYEELLDLEFKELNVEQKYKWHNDMQVFSVSDRQTKELLGYFYLDMFPRDNKYKHACCADIQSSYIMDNKRMPAIAALICNFSKNLPLNFEEVTTFFHEFGHAMHVICAKPYMSCHSGFGVEWDFVEAPSQMLEEFCYDKTVLTRMSKHIETGQTIDDDTINKLIKSKQINQGWFYKRQIALCILDMTIHVKEDFNKQNIGLDKITNKIMEQILLLKMPDEANFLATFTHLVGGYDAGYYGYLWSKVFAVDMFISKFKKFGVLNKETGLEYRKKILESGSTKDSMELLKDFLGRDVSEDMFLEYLGIKE